MMENIIKGRTYSYIDCNVYLTIAKTRDYVIGMNIDTGQEKVFSETEVSRLKLSDL